MAPTNPTDRDLNWMLAEADRAKVEERAWKKIETIPECGCWMWVGATKKKGYGSFAVGGVSFGAHQVIYALYKGLVPKGLQLDHLCRVRSCVNPDHLEPVTSLENRLRGESLVFKASRSSYCKNGHIYNAKNTRYVSLPDGYTGRACRVCDKEAARARRRNKKRAFALAVVAWWKEMKKSNE